MSLSDHLSQLAGAVEQTRSKRNEVSQKIEELKSRRHEIKYAKPHTDDIVDSLMRSLDGQAREFEAELREGLNSVFVSSDSAAESAGRVPISLLGLEAKRPDPVQIADRRARGITPPVNLGALAFLLRDKLANEVPALVDRLCPGSRSGMKQVDRQKALAEIDAKISELEAEREALNAELEAARRLVSGQQGY